MSNVAEYQTLTLDNGNVVDEFGRIQNDALPRHKVRRLENEGGCYRLHETVNGKVQLRHEPIEYYNNIAGKVQVEKPIANRDDLDHEELRSFLDTCITLRPDHLVMSNPNWRYLVRSVLRGKNIMMTGPSGAGKTLAAQAISEAFPDREYFYFNLGATQDARSTLIGNTHFNNTEGTFVADALFVRAIQTPNAIILMDELTRATADAWNILITVLDANQRYLRIDERPDTPTVNVADGVTFIATANIGAEYTATRVLDKAITERFSAIIEMPHLTQEDEISLLRSKFPDLNTKMIKAIAEVADVTRRQVKSDDPKVSTAISSRTTVEIAGLLYDGFSFEEAASVAIYPLFDDAGGVDSERTFLKQLVQKYNGAADADPLAQPWENQVNKI